MKKLFIFLILVLSLIINWTFESLAKYNSDPNQYFVISLNQTRIWPSPFPSYYTPSKLSPKEMERIPFLISRCKEKYNNLKDNWIRGGNLIDKEYIVQIVPMLNTQREKEVWLNVICKEYAAGLDVQNNIIQAFSGKAGRCYFHFQANLTKETITDLYVHGMKIDDKLLE